MDRYNERLFVANTSAISVALFIFSICFTVASLPLVILSPPLGVLLLVIGIALITFTKDGLKCEYEYIITNGDIEIAKVIAKKRRKELALIEASNISRMTLASDERVANDISIGKYKVRKYLGKETVGKEVALFIGEGDNQSLYILDFDDECIDHMNQVLKTKSEIRK